MLQYCLVGLYGIRKVEQSRKAETLGLNTAVLIGEHDHARFEVTTTVVMMNTTVVGHEQPLKWL